MQHYTEKEIDRELHQYDSMAGAVGGVSPHKQRLINAMIFVFVIAAFGVGIFFIQDEWIGKVALEVAVLLISIKLGFYLHNSVKFNHYSFWVFAAFENRLLEVKQQLREQVKLLQELQKGIETR